jgi:hypothetical protein
MLYLVILTYVRGLVALMSVPIASVGLVEMDRLKNSS